MDSSISLKELILLFETWIRYFLNQWKVIIIIVLVGSGIGCFYAHNKKPTYTAQTTFVLEEKNAGGGLNTYSGIAAQFGINLGGGDNTLFSVENIMELMKSRLMIEKALMSSIDIDSGSKLLIDIYLSSKDVQRSQQSKLFNDFGFSNSIKENKLTNQQDSIVGVIYNSIITSNLNVSRKDNKLSIISLKVTSESQEFSKGFNEQLLKHVTSFYVSTKTKKLKDNVDILQMKTDSIKEELDVAIVKRASFGDQNLNLVSQSAQIVKLRTERDVQVLSSMYTELIKNLELAKLTLAKEEPLIQVIDTPHYPLQKNRLSKLKAAVVGGIVALMFTLFGLTLVRIYSQVMNEE